MLTDKQLDIFATFAKYPFKELTRQEVKHLANEKSNNTLNIAFSQFKKENLLLEQKVGKSSLYKLNFNENTTIQYLALCNEKRLKKVAKDSLSEITSEVKKSTTLFTIVVFGSYATGEENKSSDLDVAIITNDKTKIKEIERNLSSAKLKSIIELDTHVIIYDDFFKMLINKEENLGKQIARKHLAIYNHQLFYDLLFEGLNHGFKY